MKNVKKNVWTFILVALLSGAVVPAFAQSPNFIICDNVGVRLKPVDGQGGNGESFKWVEVDGKLSYFLSGKTGPQLEIQAGDIGPGTYSFVRLASATGCTDVPSNTYTVLVVASPIAPEVEALNICEGLSSPLNFRVTNDASQTPLGGVISYTWSNATAGGSADGGTYTWPGTSTNIDAGYAASVTATITTAGKACTSGLVASAATVYANPVITTNESSLSACGIISHNLEISVSVSGENGSVSIQWYNGHDANAINAISGETSATYTTPVLSAATPYSVKVSRTDDGSLACASVANITTKAVSLTQGEIEGEEI